MSWRGKCGTLRMRSVSWGSSENPASMGCPVFLLELQFLQFGRVAHQVSLQGLALYHRQEVKRARRGTHSGQHIHVRDWWDWSKLHPGEQTVPPGGAVLTGTVADRPWGSWWHWREAQGNPREAAGEGPTAWGTLPLVLGSCQLMLAGL